MKQLIAFFKKECMEVIRSSKFMLIIILGVVFGIMNPAIAKLTPVLMEFASESLSEAGIVVTEVEVNAMTSWTQFYKNVPILMIAFLFIFSSIMTIEYQRGTLINMVTKGLDRWKIVISKMAVTFILWTLMYWMCFGITYGYNAFFWDNSIVCNAVFGALCIYVLGIWLITLIILMSTIVSANTTVALLTGGVFGIFYLAGMVQRIEKYLPTKLAGVGELLNITTGAGDFYISVIVCIVLSIVNISVAVLLFNKKNL